jgi:hypothetical protein
MSSRRRTPSPAAERMRRHRARLRDGKAVVSVQVSGEIVDYLAREGLIPGAREFADRAEIGAAASAALERLARSENSRLRVTTESRRRV